MVRKQVLVCASLSIKRETRKEGRRSGGGKGAKERGEIKEEGDRHIPERERQARSTIESPSLSSLCQKLTSPPPSLAFSSSLPCTVSRYLNTGKHSSRVGEGDVVLWYASQAER